MKGESAQVLESALLLQGKVLMLRLRAWYISRKALLLNARTERLQTLEMVAVYMTEKACERVVSPMQFSKVINLYQVSDAGVKALVETNFELQETLYFCKPVCMRHDGIRTLYDSLECRHPETLASDALLESPAICQDAKLSSKSFSPLMTYSGYFMTRDLFGYAVET